MYNFVIGRPDLPDDLVYQLVKAVFRNQRRLVKAHPAARETLPPNILKNTSIPVRYDLSAHGGPVDLGVRHAILLDQADRIPFEGVRQGTVIAWPKTIKDGGGIRNQFHHFIDIVPTILEATGIPAPVMVDGVAQKPIEGVSMMYTFDKANANAPSTHTTQYFEMMADRAIYHDGWIASTKVIRPPWDIVGAVNPDPANNVTWELYDLTKDWTQSNDVAAANSAKLKTVQDLFWVEAAKNNVLPLDASVATRVVIPRPSLAAGRSTFVYSGELTGIPPGDAPSVLNTSYTITADVEIPRGGAEGMLNTNGGRFGGYGLCLVKGKPVFTWNLLDLKRIRWEAPAALSPGKHQVEFDFKYDGLGFATLAFNNLSGIGRGGTGTL